MLDMHTTDLGRTTITSVTPHRTMCRDSIGPVLNGDQPEISGSERVA